MTKNRIAYAEAYSYIDSLPTEEFYKIPRDVVEYIDWHRDYNYEFDYDCTKTVDEQNISKEGRALILKIFLKYFADEEKKRSIYKILDENKLKRDAEIIMKSNRENMFKKEVKVEEVETSQNTELVEVKETAFTKIKNFILKLIHRG